MKDSRISADSQPAAPGLGVIKQQRAIRTRQELTQAARELFASNGFEHASIEDIATKAGKTRGAFYANFEDKEDVFLAIFEEDFVRDQKNISRFFSKVSGPEEYLEALSKHLYKFLRDEQRSLLYLEFKMYAIRHPSKRKRLVELHRAMCLRYILEIDRVMSDFTEGREAIRRKQSLEVSAAMDGLALNMLFDPGTLTQQQILNFLRSNLRNVLLTKQVGRSPLLDAARRRPINGDLQGGQEA